MNKKIIIFVTAMVLVFAMVTGATLAYFVSNAGEVTNNFVPSKFGTPAVSETPVEENKYYAVPGVDIKKDPKVTYTVTAVTAGEEKKQVSAYLYLAVKASSDWTVSTNGMTYTQKIGTVNNALNFTINSNNWKHLGIANGYHIYVYMNGSAEAKVSTSITAGIEVITGNKVYVNKDVTKPQMEAESTLGTVAFTAHAVQAEFNTSLDAKTAWNTVNNDDNKIS